MIFILPTLYVAYNPSYLQLKEACTVGRHNENNHSNKARLPKYLKHLPILACLDKNKHNNDDNNGTITIALKKIKKIPNSKAYLHESPLAANYLLWKSRHDGS